MAVSDELKKFRSGGYGKKEEEQSSSPRLIKLTDEEAKELQGYSQGPGTEQECLVTGRLGENGEFSVTSVHGSGGEQTQPDMNAGAEEVMAKMRGPMTQMQTMPSPS